MKKSKNYPPHFYLDKVKITTALIFIIMLFSINVKSQNFIGNSSSTYSGDYLRHKGKIIIGDTIIVPERYLHLHKPQNLGGGIISHLDVGIHFSTEWSGSTTNDGFDLGYYTGVAATNYVNFNLLKNGQFNFITNGDNLLLIDTNKIYLGGSSINGITVTNWPLRVNYNAATNNGAILKSTNINGDLDWYFLQDEDSTNELITDFEFTGDSLKITDAGGTRGVDLRDLNANYWTQTSTEKLYYNSGFIGIGTNNPNRQLQIHSIIDEGGEAGGTGTGGPKASTYKSSVLLTNIITGTTEFDGLKLESNNNNGNLRLQEAGELSLTVGNYGIRIKQDGNLKFDKLAGTGERVLITDAQGNISAVETNSFSDNLGNHIAEKNINMNGFSIYNSEDTKQFVIVNSDNGSGINLYSNNYDIGGTNEWRKGSITIHTKGEKGDIRFSNFDDVIGWKTLMTVKADGNVGIGTNNPTEKLTIEGENQNIKISNTEESQAGLIFIDKQVENNQFAKIMFDAGNNNDLSFYVNNSTTSKMVIKPNGNVGIGTDSPQNKLEIIGDNPNIKLVNSGENYEFGLIFADNDFLNNSTYQGRIIYNHQEIWNPKMKFFVKGSIYPQLIIDGFGNIGIGTSILEEKLTVSGNILAEGLTIKGKILAEEVEVVANIDPPDYVFEKDYKLLSIYDLEKFVNENSHLPEIPSADDIDKNNLKLGEMNLLLLKKVEELTLYIIDLQKQIDELKEN